MFLITNQIVRPTSNASFYVILQQFQKTSIFASGIAFILEHRVKRIMTRKKFLSFVYSHTERKINCAIYVSLLFSDIDECSSKTHDCDRTALCKNTEGSFSCTCKPGYKRDGKKCKGSTRNYRIVCFYQSNTFVIDSQL